LVSTGPQTGRVLEAAELLATSAIDASVIHVPSLKPVDASALVDAVAGADLVVTVEEHSVYGGLGGLVAEILTAAGPSPQIERIGVDDTWGESAGNDFMLDKHGLTPEKIADRVRSVISVSTGG
jgi:transketolase